MANISTELETIYSGVFGEDIRNAIYSALDKINKSGGSGGSGGSTSALEFRSIANNADIDTFNTEDSRGIYRLLTRGDKTASQYYKHLPADYSDKLGGFMIVYGVGTFIRQEIFYIANDPTLGTYRWTRSYANSAIYGQSWSAWIRTGEHDQLTFRLDRELDTPDLNLMNTNYYRGIYRLLASKVKEGYYDHLPDANTGFNRDLAGFLIIYAYDSLVRQEIIHIAMSEEYLTYRWVRTYNGTSWSPWVRTGSGSGSGSSGNDIFHSWIQKNSNLNNFNSSAFNGVYGLLASNNSTITNLPSEFNKNMAGFLTVFNVGSCTRQEIFYIARDTSYLTYSFVRTYNGNEWSNWTTTMSGGSSVAPDQIVAAVEAYMTEHPVEPASAEDIASAVEAYMEENPVDPADPEVIENAVTAYMNAHPVDPADPEAIADSVETYMSSHPVGIFKTFVPANANLNNYKGEEYRGVYGLRPTDNPSISNLPSDFNKTMGGLLVILNIGSFTRQEVFYLAASTDYLSFSFVRTSRDGTSWSDWIVTSSGSSQDKDIDPEDIESAVASYMADYPACIFKSFIAANENLNNYRGGDGAYRGIYAISPGTSISGLPSDFKTSKAAFLFVFSEGNYARQELFYADYDTAYINYSYVRAYNGTTWSSWVSTASSGGSVDPADIAEAVSDYMDGYEFNLGVNSINNWAYVDRSKMGIITPQMFGAVADGSTNCSAAINSAINAALGKTVYFPAGTYCISSMISTYKSHAQFTNLVFDKGAIIKATSSMTYMLDIGGDGNSVANEKGYKKFVTGGTFESNGYVTGSVIFINDSITDVDFSNSTIKCSNGCAGITVGRTSSSSTDCYIHHVNVIGNKSNQTGNGVIVNSSDNSLDSMRVYYFKTCVTVYSGGTFLSNIHTLVNPNVVSDSVSFAVGSSSKPEVFMHKCYGDSTSVYLKFLGIAYVNVSQGMYYSYLDGSGNCITRMITFDISDVTDYKLNVDQFKMFGYRLSSGSHVGLLVDSLDGHFYHKVSKDKLQLRGVKINYPQYMVSGDVLKGSVSENGWIIFKPTAMSRVDSTPYWYKLGTFQWGTSATYSFEIEFRARSGCRTIVPIYAYFNSSGSSLTYKCGSKIITTDAARYKIGILSESTVTVNGTSMCCITIYIAQNSTTSINLEAARITTNTGVIPSTVSIDSNTTLQQYTSTPSGLTIFDIDCSSGSVSQSS